jgi:hypothetical protein
MWKSFNVLLTYSMKNQLRLYVISGTQKVEYGICNEKRLYLSFLAGKAFIEGWCLKS